MKKADKSVIDSRIPVSQNELKNRQSAELILTNKELAFQNEEKHKRVAEPIIAKGFSKVSNEILYGK